MKTLFAFALAALLALPVTAQERQQEISDDVKWTLVAAQIKVSLENDQDAVKTQTMKNAIVLATLYRDKVDLSGSVQALRKTHLNATSSNHRRLALAALQAIGTNRAQDHVARNATPEQYDESRLVVASVLNDYYVAHVRNS